MLTYDPDKPKRCRKCGELKDTTEFAPRTYPSGKVGLQSWCRICIARHVAELRRAGNRNIKPRMKAPARDIPVKRGDRFADLPAPAGCAISEPGW